MKYLSNIFLELIRNSIKIYNLWKCIRNTELSWSYRADTDKLVRVIHHRDQEIKEHDDVYNREAAEHYQPPEPGELFDPRQLKVVQVYQTKRGPE